MNHWLLRVWTLVILAALVGAGSLYAQEDPVLNDSSWNYNFGPVDVNGPVYEVAIAPNGDVYIGGNFTQVNGLAANRIARWNGTAWSALGAGIGNGSVRAIAFSGNNVYAGGSFTEAGSVIAHSIAQWNGSQWSYLGKRDNEQGLDSTINEIIFVGNTMYVAGSFIYGGNNDMLNRIARWSPTEKVFIGLEGTTTRGLDDTVYAMVAQGNTIYVGGRFPNAGGATAARVAKYDIDKGEWSKLGSGVGQTGSSGAYVTTMAIKDSILYVGGSFSFAGGKSARRLAKWSIPQQDWFGVVSNVKSNGIDSIPTSMALDANGDLYVGGYFSNAGVFPARHIVKWHNPDSTWSSLGTGINGTPFAMAAQGKYLYVGGSFTQAGVKNSQNFARWIDSAIAAPDDTVPPDTNTVSAPERIEYASATLAAVPNPTNGSTNISFTVPASGLCTVDIRNVHGETVATLVSDRLEAGAYNIRWNAAGMPDGVYFCNLRSGDLARTTKLVLVR